MSEARPYNVRILYRFIGSEKDYVHEVRVTATDAPEAQKAARMLWIDTTPAGRGVQWLGSSAEPDNGQLSLL